MRLTVAGLRRVVKRDLEIQFTDEQLTSYAGLELVRRYFERIGLFERIELMMRAEGLCSDYGNSRVVVLLLALLIVGGRRLEHLKYLVGDPLVARLSRLKRLPSARTVSNWLRQFTVRRLQSLRRLNEDVVCDQIAQLKLRRLTIDVDGTVVRTGPRTAWAMRGYNPHHPKDPSYYPLLAHLAQTGQILRLRNRPGNVHDSKGALRFLREIISGLRTRFGRGVALEFRMDAAFFQREILRLLQRHGCTYAIKVPFWSRGTLKPIVAAQRVWTALSEHVSAFETQLPLVGWDMTVRVVVYRKRVGHPTRKNFQLDLFSPDDGTFEYSAITTNTTLGTRALWQFMAGRGAQERTLAELKGEFGIG